MDFLCGISTTQRLMASVAAGAMAEKFVGKDTLPLMFKSLPVVGPVLGDSAAIFLSSPPVVAGIATEVACRPRDAYQCARDVGAIHLVHDC